jgi:ABC-type ATPase involved in cell division
MIELEGVRVDHPRGGSPLLEAADLAFDRGQVVLIGAAAGAGSSWLCSVLVGEQIATTGRVELFGRDLRRLRRASLLRLRRKVGVIPQDLRLLGDATALDNVLLPLDIDHVPRREASLRAAEALGRVGLAAELDVHVDQLSMAERQRVAIARALVREPAIVVADQPTCFQDAERAYAIARVFAECAAAGATVLIASRDPVLWGCAADFGWRTMIMREGRMIEASPPEEIVTEADVLGSAPIPRPPGHPDRSGRLASVTPISTAIEPPTADAIPNVVPFPITARSRGVR